MSVNKVILIGRLGKNPEVRFTGSGKAVANFSIACDESYKDSNGERQKKTEWVNLVLWGKTAELAGQYLHKGDLTYFEGRLQTRKWQDKEGQDRYSTEVVVNDMRFLEKKKDGHAAGGNNAPESGLEVTDEDIPF